MLWLLTGPVNSGKSRYVKVLIELLRADFSIKIGGIINHGLFRAGSKIGYQCEDLLTGRRNEFAKKLKENTLYYTSSLLQNGDVKLGSWVILKEGLLFAIQALEQAFLQKAELIIVDEFGILELDGEGFRTIVDRLIKTRLNLLIVVREDLLKEVTEIYKSHNPTVIYPDELNDDKIKLKDSSVYRWFARNQK